MRRQQEAEQQYSRYDQFRPEQAVVVPPGVDARRFHPQELPGEEQAVAELMRPFLRHPAKPPLLCICRAVRRKNVPALVEAYGRSALLRERHNLVLVLGCREDPRAMEKQQRDQFQQPVFQDPEIYKGKRSKEQQRIINDPDHFIPPRIVIRSVVSV